MKVRKDFAPLTVEIESPQEAELVLSTLIIGVCHMATTFRKEECEVIRDLISKLRNIGIKEA